jgi:curli biogenesis system outer membrane secretion channel CsgG
MRLTGRYPRILGALALFTLGACTSPVPINGKYAEPLGTAPVIDNPTPYTQALFCLGHAIARQPSPYMLAVGKVEDYTGKDDLETGKRLTQGAALMVMSALGKAAVPLVERFDTSVTEMELKYANNKLIGDGQGPYRKILSGSLPGSTQHIIGGITEINYNIRSNSVDGLWDVVSGSAQLYVLNVGLDLRLVETQSLRVRRVVSYQKQVLGREVRAGLFEFFGSKLLDIGFGERSLEPIQLAVRSVIERGVFEMVRELYNIPAEQCGAYLTHGDKVFNGPTKASL